MTLFDKIDKFMSSYIRKSVSDKEEVISENDIGLYADDYTEESKKFSMTVEGKKLTPELRRRMALTAPFYMKGLRKKCRDTFRAGWGYKKDSGDRPPKIELDVIEEFNKRVNIEHFMELMKQDAHVYGDGLCLYIFVNDQNVKKPDLSKKPNKTAEFYSIKRLNPEFFTEYRYKNEYYKKQGIQHLYYNNLITGEEIFIHPDRLYVFEETDFAFTKLGISDMDILRHILSSQADIDKATGEILKWFASGIVHWTRDGAGRNEIKEMRKIANKHPKIYLGNEKSKLQVENAEAIDPEPFYNYIISAIAAVLVMPVHVLQGTTVGETTGAEAGYADYNKDVRDSQRLIYAPALTKIYEMLYKAKFTDKKTGIQTRRFDYNIEFNPMYVGEMAEAEIDAKRSATAVNLKTGGIIDNVEARKYINDGHIYLEPDKKIKTEDNQFRLPTQPNPRTEQAVPKKEKENISDDNKLKSTNPLEELWNNKEDEFWDDVGKREEILQNKRIAKSKDKLKKLKDKLLKDD